MQCEDAARVLEPIVDGLVERKTAVTEFGKGEVVKLLQAIDIDLGELFQLLAVVVAVTIGIEPLDGHGGVGLVERPGLLKAGHGVAVLIKHRCLDAHPHVRVCATALAAPKHETGSQ